MTRQANQQRRQPAALRSDASTLRRSFRASSFTLIELLVVLTIIGMLMGIGLTSMEYVGRSQALSAGARQFANDINMARNYAVDNGKFVYLVVATKDTVTNSVNFAYSAYGFCAPYASSASPTVLNFPTQVQYIDALHFLPQGVVFDPVRTNYVNSIQVAFPTNKFNATNLATTVAWVVTFTPTGQVLPATQRPQFYLYAGQILVTNGVNPYLPTPTTAAGTNGYVVEINPLLGKPVVYRQ